MNDVEIRRSARRKRTVTAERRGDKTVVMVPHGLTEREEHQIVTRLVDKLYRRERRLHLGDNDLFERACRLSEQWLAARAVPSSVRWVSNQNSRWASCTHTTGQIRVSDRLIGVPEYVIDYVLVHELAHLIEPNHSPSFHALVAAYPQTARAQGFLEGVQWKP